MPYIDNSTGRRDEIDLSRINQGEPFLVGELNYAITKLCTRFILDSHSYAYYNMVIGALECAKLEFYRRLVAVYEDKKMEENGDVYGA